MRTITGYDGRTPRWSENTPAEARSSHLGGSSIEGAPGPNDAEVRHRKEAAFREAARERRRRET